MWAKSLRKSLQHFSIIFFEILWTHYINCIYYLQWNKFYVVSSKKREVLWHRTLDRVVVRKNHIMLIDLRQFNQIIIKTEPMTTNNENGGFNYVFKMYISFIVFLFIFKKNAKIQLKRMNSIPMVFESYLH